MRPRALLRCCILVLLPLVIRGNVNIGPASSDTDCPLCTKDIECNDNNPCTRDTCLYRRGVGYTCIHAAIPECEHCQSCSDCDDRDPCTVDDCVSGKCEYTDKPGCGELLAKRIGQATPLRGQYSRITHNTARHFVAAIATGFNSHVDPLWACQAGNLAACNAAPNLDIGGGFEHGAAEGERVFEVDGKTDLPIPGFEFDDNVDTLKWLDDTQLDHSVDILDFYNLPPRLVHRERIPAPYDPVAVTTSNGAYVFVIAKVSCSPATHPTADLGEIPCLNGQTLPGKLFIYDVGTWAIPIKQFSLHTSANTKAWPTDIKIADYGRTIIVTSKGPLGAEGWVQTWRFIGGSLSDYREFRSPPLDTLQRCLGGGGHLQDKLYLCGNDWNVPPNLQSDRDNENEGADALRVYGEPASIAVSPDQSFAFISMKRNNGIMVLRLGESPAIVGIACTGWKNMLLKKNAFDASAKDNGAYLKPYPVLAMYQPDGILVDKHDGDYTILTANAGMANLRNMKQVKDLKLWDKVFTIGDYDPAELQRDDRMGGLWIFGELGKVTEQYEKLFMAGGRSISLWNMPSDTLEDPTTGKFEQLWDSANILEKELKMDKASPFNGVWKSDDNSPITGPEPSRLVKGEVFGLDVLFVSLKGASAVAMFSLEDPLNPAFMQILSFAAKDMDGEILGGDVGTYDLEFIRDTHAPNGCPLLLTTNPGDKHFYPGSGTLGIWQFERKGVPCERLAAG